MINSKGVQVATEDGLLTAKYNGHSDYPGIRIELDGVLVAMVEYDETYGIRTIAWNNREDEPSNVTVFNEDV